MNKYIVQAKGSGQDKPQIEKDLPIEKALEIYLKAKDKALQLDFELTKHDEEHPYQKEVLYTHKKSQDTWKMWLREEGDE